MKAVVMAGGAGSRLRPLTINRPKPMVPMVNKSVIGHILDLLKRHGITDVIITLQYMAEDIQDHLGDGHNLGMNIQYSICLLYTSDAADDLLCVDLGGRRII